MLFRKLHNKFIFQFLLKQGILNGEKNFKSLTTSEDIINSLQLLESHQERLHISLSSFRFVHMT